MEIREVIGTDHRAKEQIDINRDIYIYIYSGIRVKGHFGEVSRPPSLTGSV